MLRMVMHEAAGANKMGRALLALSAWLMAFAVQLALPSSAHAAEPYLAAAAFKIVLATDAGGLEESHWKGADDTGPGAGLAEPFSTQTSVARLLSEPRYVSLETDRPLTRLGSNYDARGPPLA